MRRVTHAVQKQKGISRAAPIQVVEPHAVGGDESSLVGRLVRPIGLSIDLSREHQRRPDPPKLCWQLRHATTNSCMSPVMSIVIPLVDDARFFAHDSSVLARSRQQNQPGEAVASGWDLYWTQVASALMIKVCACI